MAQAELEPQSPSQGLSTLWATRGTLPLLTDFLYKFENIIPFVSSKPTTVLFRLIFCDNIFFWTPAFPHLSFSVIDRSDDQRGGVFTSIIRSGTEEWIEFLGEGAASERVDMRPGLHIIKGDHTLLIVHKYPHLLVLLLKHLNELSLAFLNGAQRLEHCLMSLHLHLSCWSLLRVWSPEPS